MKKKQFWPLLVVALFTFVLASCDQNKTMEPEPPFTGFGQYQATYAPTDDDMPHTAINLDLKQINDSTSQAQMAFYHYYKDNLLFSEVTDMGEPVIKNDTILLDLVMPEGEKMTAKASEDRHLRIKLLHNLNTLKILSSSDDKILPNILFHKAVTHEDSATIRFDSPLPRTTMVDGIYYINGPIKKFSASSTTGATLFEYYFNENGVVTGYKDAYGKLYDYEVGEIGEGMYYSFLDRNGRHIELSYCNSNQLSSDNTMRNLTSYYYDQHGRMSDGFFKSYKAFYAFELVFDDHGTLVGKRNKDKETFETKYIVETIDNYGNPLEQSIDYCNGKKTGPYHYAYEYYE